MVTEDDVAGGHGWLLWMRTMQMSTFYICIDIARQVHPHQCRCKAMKRALYICIGGDANAKRHCFISGSMWERVEPLCICVNIAWQLCPCQHKCRATSLCIYIIIFLLSVYLISCHCSSSSSTVVTRGSQQWRPSPFLSIIFILSSVKLIILW